MLYLYQKKGRKTLQTRKGSKMDKWMMVEIQTNGEWHPLPARYDSERDAAWERNFCKDVNPHKGYVIMTVAEWEARKA